MSNELLNLKLFSVEVFLSDTDHRTGFVTFAKDAEAAEFYVTDYIQHYITDDFKVYSVHETMIKEGLVIVND